ncbi:hypothetical protein H4R19_004580 [Coemansia spiralis]|nr:hypothetical protein H4R19_004580 [Coemansia spiralis]
MAIASTTPERPLDTRATERMDAEDLDLLATLPKPDLPRLNLLRVCIEVLRECEDVDEVIGWVDLRVWRALGAWFVGHPHNNLLHMSVYQLLSIVTLEAVRLRRARRMQQGPWPRAPPPPPPAETATKPGQASLRRLHKLHDTGGRVGSRSGASAAEAGGYLSADAQSSGAPEPTAQLVAKRRALRRRAVAERLRREEASSCDNVLTYLVEQLRWIDKLIRRAASPNFDGAHGYISLILNTLRLAVQVDRRRCFSAAAPGKAAALSGAAQHAQAEADGMQSEDSDSEAILPDLAYHDPATRERLSEYPLYRLQRWEISLLYSPAFRAHLRALRRQALLTARKIVEFRLCDQMHRVISSESDGTGKRPVPFFSPQKVRPPQLLDNADLKKKQMQINVGLLLGSRCAAALSPSSSKASSSAAPAPTPGPTTAKNAAHEAHPIDEIGINLDSLYARMLGFTEDLVRPVPPPPAAGNRSASKGDSVAVAEAYLAAGADAATDEEDSEHDARTRKCSAGGYSKAGSARRKKSRPAATMPGTGLFEDMAPESAADAAEAICSALVGDGCAAPATSRHAPCVRGRKKAVAATGSVRRRRARLQRRSSASSLTGAPNSNQASPSVAPAAEQTEAPDSPLLPPADVAAPAAVGLSQSMQSLDLEQ